MTAYGLCCISPIPSRARCLLPPSICSPIPSLTPHLLVHVRRCIICCRCPPGIHCLFLLEIRTTMGFRPLPVATYSICSCPDPNLTPFTVPACDFTFTVYRFLLPRAVYLVTSCPVVLEKNAARVSALTFMRNTNTTNPRHRRTPTAMSYKVRRRCFLIQ